ncbi:MAG: S8 family serine peptidase [Chitinophagales bacterium]|nr:S8 family serine peptidase [Chitinophagales bacterium]
MKKLSLSFIFLLLVTIVFGQYKEGQVCFKLKSNLSLANLSGRDEDKFNTIKSTFAVKNVYRTFSHLDDETLSLIYTVEAPVSINESALVEALQSLSMVDYAERVPQHQLFYTPNDPLQSQQWYLGANYINAYNAWNLNTGLASVKLAIVDDEVRVTHDDLKTKIYTNTAEIAGNGIDDDNNGYIDDRNGWDAGDNDNNPNRPASAPAGTMIHGTHCAGIAAAATNNALGVASIGNGVSIIPVKVNRDANTANYLDNPYGGVEYAIAVKANVVSLSWGGGGFSQSEQLLFNYGYSQGIVFVAAAGNNSSSSMHYPSAYNHVIAVASSTTNDLKSGFSNYGTWVDITAPGSNIYSCIGNADNTYGMMSGTSMACPMVAGLCALMLSNSPSLTPDALESCLKNSADNIDALNPGYAGKLGSGRIDAYNALKCLPCLAKSTFTIGANNQQNYAVGSTISFTSTGFGNSYKWLLNGTLTSTQSSFSQVFNTKGNYTMQLVTNDNVASCADTMMRYFTVYDSIPKVCRPLQDGNWYFGVNAGVSFLTDPPTVMSGNVNMVNGSSTLSNDCGGMQFYSDGLSIWDKNGTAMPNGTGLYGSSTACRSAMIIPKTDSADVYYVFTIDYNGGSRGLRYSIVDLRLPGNGTILNPRGDVRVKNVIVESRACEKQNAILHSNGRDYWLITHDCNNNNFYSVLVTSTAVMPSVVSSIANENFANNSTDGEIEFSPDGTKMAATFFQNTTHNLSIYGFDRGTGLITPTTQVTLGDSYNDCAYGLEFSPDCSKLYATTMCNPALYQYDFNTASLSLIATDVKNNPNYGFGEMKLAPNNKIYVNRWGYSTMGVIHNPNAAGVACNYCSNASGNCGSLPLTGLQLSSGASMKAGLSGYPKTTFGGCNLSFNAKDSCVNNPVFFTTLDPIRYCKGTTRFVWTFGDPQSSTNTSNIQNPTHVYSKAGSYVVGLSIYSPCDTINITKTVNIVCCTGSNENQSSKTSICAGDTAQIIASHLGVSYSWTPSNTLSNSLIYNPKAFPLNSTTYIVSIVNGDGCQNVDTVFVDVVAKPIATIEEKKSCTSDTLSIVPAPAFYMWNTGVINKSIVVSQSGLYSALLRNTSGCYVSLSSSFQAFPPSQIITKIGNQLCTDAAGVRYQWYRNNVLLPGDTFQCLTITSSGQYYVEISDNDRHCTNMSTKLNYEFNSVANVLGTLGVSLLPSPNNGNFTLRWNKGDRISASIFNTIGQLVYETVLPMDISESQLLLSDILSAGEYILWLKSNRDIQRIRFEVQ